jgi:hypothetical protein
MSAKSMSHSRPMLDATARSRFGIQGFVSPGFEPVQEEFTENFVRRGEAGGACCAFHNGEKIRRLMGRHAQ